jgi:integrase/recombinase XerD
VRPQEVTKAVLERFQRWQFLYRKKDGKPLGFSSQAGRIVALRHFFRWLSKTNHLLYSPATDLETPKVSRRLPHFLTAAEVERVLAQPDLKTPVGLRDRALMEVLYSTGCVFRPSRSLVPGEADQAFRRSRSG